MSRFVRTRSGEARRNVDELEPELRRRLIALDEPGDWSDWEDVIRRSRTSRFSRRRVAALVGASCVAVTAAWAIIDIRPLEPGRSGVEVRAAASASLVLYSQSRRAEFINVADGRRRGTAIRWLDGFNRRLPIDNRTGTAALPGDQSLVEFSLYTTSALKERAGSGILTCRYGVAHNALCEASFRLSDGSTLTASGLLELDRSEYSFALTGGSGRYADETGEVVQNSSPNLGHRLTFQLLPQPS